ncbi:MAG TPA: cytochrome c biogenesis protein ResB [Spirochaetia bacterium]|nr:cytochrome c biogenesis protein ResB [Spirochaetia bacterium]
MRKFLDFLRSMRLALILIAYLAATGVLATLVPQGREPEFYAGAYPKLVADLILSSGFSSFFRSWLFVLPSFLFFANLSACTMTRLLRELRKTGRRRHGPDILHVGLMLLVVGAVLTFSGRKEGFVRLAEGDAVELPDGRLLRLDRFEFLRYGDGRPKEWTSQVSVLKDGKTEREAFPIRVNNPLKLGRLSIYQTSHSVERALVVRLAEAPSGQAVERSLAQGEEFEAGGATLFFMAPDEGSGKALVRLKDAKGASSVLKLGPGEAAGPFLVASFGERDLTGLEAVVDPGYYVVLAALVLVGLGTFLAFIQKLKDQTE